MKMLIGFGAALLGLGLATTTHAQVLPGTPGATGVPVGSPTTTPGVVPGTGSPTLPGSTTITTPTGVPTGTVVPGGAVVPGGGTVAPLSGSVPAGLPADAGTTTRPVRTRTARSTNARAVSPTAVPTSRP